MSLAQLEYNLKVCALSHYIHSFLLTNPCETSMIYDALEYLFCFSLKTISEKSLMYLQKELIMTMFGLVSQILPHGDCSFHFHQHFCLILCRQGKPRMGVCASVYHRVQCQGCRPLRLFWGTHCSLCWTTDDKKKSIFKSPSLTRYLTSFTITEKLGETNKDHKEVKHMTV